MPTPWGIIVAIFAYFYQRRIYKSNQESAAGLTSNELFTVSVSLFFEPVWSGLIYYLGWKDKYPTKSRQAGKMAVIFFILGCVVTIGFWSVFVGYLVSGSLL